MLALPLKLGARRCNYVARRAQVENLKLSRLAIPRDKVSAGKRLAADKVSNVFHSLTLAQRS